MERVLPTYLVIDTSDSMTSRVHEVQQLIVDVQLGLLENPLAGEVVRASVITFNDFASLDLPLADLTEVSQFPAIRTGGDTYYAPAFSLLRDTIVRDLRVLQQRDVSVMRPFVVFITDSEPNDAAESWYGALTSLMKSVRPNILCVGLPGANMDTLARIATLRPLHVDRLGQVSEVMRSALNWTVTSVTVKDREELSYPDLEVW